MTTAISSKKFHYVTAREVCPNANYINGVPSQLLDFATQMVLKPGAQRRTPLVSPHSVSVMLFLAKHAAFTTDGIVSFSLSYLQAALSLPERHLLAALQQLEEVKLLLRDSGYSDRTQNRYKIFMHTDLFNPDYFGLTSGKADVSTSTKEKLSSSSTQQAKDNNSLFVNEDVLDILEQENPSFESDRFKNDAKYTPLGVCYYKINRSQYAYFLKLMPTLPPFKPQAEVDLPPSESGDDDSDDLPDIAF